MLKQIKRKILKIIYPFLITINKLTGTRRNIYSSNKPSLVPFSRLTMETNEGKILAAASYIGKKVLVVNTASDCGYTQQYESLQYLWEQHKDKLEILAFPSPDYLNQERGNDADIVGFCKLYSISFPVMKKSGVKKKINQNSVFDWLTHAAANGWNEREPEWNFTKYLISEKGDLSYVFGPGIEPLEIEKYL